MAYQFRPMSADDLPLIRDWLVLPHVREWWGHPDEQFGLVSGDMSEPAMDQYVVSHDDVPFGYLQWYRLTDWNICFGPQPEATRGIDQMIGAPEMVGRGHGSAFIRVFIEPARDRHAACRGRSRSGERARGPRLRESRLRSRQARRYDGRYFASDGT